MASGGDAFDLWPLEVSQEQAFYSLHPGQKTEVGVKLNLVCFLSLMNKCTKLNNISHTILAKFTGPLSRWIPGTAKPRHGLPGPWQPYWLTLLENGDSINKSLTSVTQPAKYGGQRSEVKLSIIHNHLTRSRLCVNTNQKFIVVARAFQNVDMLSDFIKF